MGSWDHVAVPFSCSEERAQGFPRWPHRLPFPLRVDGSWSPHPASTVPPSLQDGRPDGCEGLALVALICVSLILGDGQHLCVPAGHLRVFLGGASVSVFGPCFGCYVLFVPVACGRRDHPATHAAGHTQFHTRSTFPRAAVVPRSSRPDTRVPWEEEDPGSLVSCSVEGSPADTQTALPGPPGPSAHARSKGYSSVFAQRQVLKDLRASGRRKGPTGQRLVLGWTGQSVMSMFPSPRRTPSSETQTFPGSFSGVPMAAFLVEQDFPVLSLPPSRGGQGAHRFRRIRALPGPRVLFQTAGPFLRQDRPSFL